MREKLEELARLHGEAQKTTWQAGAAREIYAAFPALLAYVRELEGERDEAQAQLAVASNNARHYADKCVELEAQVKRGKSEALREFAKSRDVEVIGNGDWYSGVQAERTATVDDLRETADRLEKEATNGR